MRMPQEMRSWKPREQFAASCSCVARVAALALTPSRILALSPATSVGHTRSRLISALTALHRLRLHSSISSRSGGRRRRIE